MKKRFFKPLRIAALLLALAALSCTTTDSTREFHPPEIAWLGEGNPKVASVSGEGVRYSLARISLDENARIVAYPDESGENGAISLGAFLKMTGASVAVNTTPYTKSKRILGIHISDGKKLSGEIGRYSAVIFEECSSGLRARIVESQSESAFGVAEFAFGGFFTILKDGEIMEFRHTSYDARSAIGIANDGKTVFILAVEKGFSSAGLSYTQCAEIMRELGATDAMEFDGGGSTSFFAENGEGNTVKVRESLRKNAAYMGFRFR